MSIVVPVNNENISDAAKIHSISWQESHCSFCSDNFINEHSVDHQQEYINSKMKPEIFISVMLLFLPDIGIRDTGLRLCSNYVKLQKRMELL